VYGTGAFPVTVAGSTVWLAPADVLAELAHPVTAATSSTASITVDLNFMPRSSSQCHLDVVGSTAVASRITFALPPA
jgi:hypothetical protein